MVRLSRRPWPFPWSVQVVSANWASVPASLAVMAPSRDGWFALTVILSFRVSRGCDLRCPVVDGVAGGAVAALLRLFQPP